MGQAKVVIDTAASMPPDMIEKYGFGMARYAVQFGDESYLDNGIDLPVEAFDAKRQSSGIVPKTGIPPTGQFVALYRSIAQPGDTIYSIHVGTKLSGIVGAAQMAAQEVPELDVVVIDSNSVCMTQGFMAIEAAEAIRAGKSKEEILAVIEDVKKRVDFYSVSVELEYLKESGRIVGAERSADAAVRNVPIIQLKDGSAGVTEQARTQNGALKRVIELIRERAGGKPIKRIAIVHADREPVALKYREMVEAELAPEQMLFGQLGITLMTHLGPGTLATSVLHSA